MNPVNTIILGDSLSILKTLESESVDCCITSPPYWMLRDYGSEGQVGLEETHGEYIERLLNIFDEVKRVLKKQGTCWVNLGDTYSGSKSGYTDTNKNGKIPKENLIKKNRGEDVEKTLLQIPARFSIGMTDRGWILRNEIIWHKPNCMPQSADDRFTVDFEKFFFFSKDKRYYFEQQREPLAESYIERAEYGWNSEHPSIAKSNPGGIHMEKMGERFVNPAGRNHRSVWSITTQSFPEAHFATYPPKLIEIPIKAGCPVGGLVLDPFMGAGTTALVAKHLSRNYLGIELNPDYIKIAERRLAQETLF